LVILALKQQLRSAPPSHIRLIDTHNCRKHEIIRLT